MGVLTLVSKDTIAEIKRSVNIVDVIGEVVSLSKSGRNFLGLCPFHGEKTPSFNVLEDKQFYHCFGCGKSGDVFKFLEEYRGINFSEAVHILADRLGMDIGPQLANQVRQARQHAHQDLIDIHEEARKFYHAYLMTTTMGQEARSYLYERGLSDDVIKHFQLGLAPSEGNYLYRAMQEKYSEDTIVNSGLFSLSDSNHIYDAFQNRIMFPLTDDEGHVIGFSGRIWQESNGQGHVAKYMNSRATSIFNKSYELYHLDQARASIKKSHEVYVMEGFMDVIAAYRSGIDNAVASMGTALTREHVAHIRRYSQKVILTYDGDSAGQAAIEKALDVLGEMQVEIVSLPGGMDPDEFLQKQSPEALAEFLQKNRISDIEFLIHHLKPDNIENLQAQIDFLDRMAPMIARVKSITAQNTYIYMLADLLSHFDYQQVEATVNQSRVAERAQRSQDLDRGENEYSKPLVREMPRSVQVSRLVKVESHLLHRMIYHPMVLNDFRLREDFHFDTRELETLYQLLCKNGEVTSLDLDGLEEPVQQAWYRVLEEDLPDEVTDTELAELEAFRNRELIRKENQQITKDIRAATQTGDVDTALEELERLIALRRRME